MQVQPIGKEYNSADKWTTWLLMVYLMVITWIILFKLGVQFSYMENRKINLIPFANGYYDKMETLMNVLIFVPLGIYATALFKRWAFNTQLIFFFLISLILESLQYLLKIGTFDITDLLTNTSGGMIGYLLFWTVGKLTQDSQKTQKFFNIVSTIGTITIVLLLILLKLNMLPIRYQ
ncbi:VanZ family protein [Algoriphagus aestuarii]|nr:VanZ family protein [Algoriphagus aestuarii]